MSFGRLKKFALDRKEMHLAKGGVWKNSEDEVLKAAIMKYGKNQWARIASLLTRKTPKQCKARWFEWLDPSIKKTDWTREEDEKLLHLAKLMPTQWRTIAPIVGRTAAQCLERYQRLLDEAELDDDDRGPNSDDVRKLRPGEIDPDPETKPARPDPVDMDDDEKEMLSEARARLANTQGKKAKRKAREKQLQDSRRLAAVQKRRELKAAGLEYKVYVRKKKMRGMPENTMDFNSDIPFHHEQPSGFWNINDEVAREQMEKKDMVNSLLSDLEGKRRIDVEQEEEKKREFKVKKQKTEGTFVPQAIREAAEELIVSERQKLKLPAPQVSEQEVEELVKMGVSGQVARSMLTDGTPSTNLLGNYTATTERTPRTMQSQGVDLKLQARNLKAMSELQTPLLGGEVVVEAQPTPTGPKIVERTPNALLQQLTPAQQGLRDQMGINTPQINRFDATPQDFTKQRLQSMFAALPKPKNDFEIVIPEISNDTQQQNIQKDGEDVVREQEERLKRQREEEFKRRSQPFQRGLERPIVSQSLLSQLYKYGSHDPDQLILNEKILLVHQDAQMNPMIGQEPLQPLEKLDVFSMEALEEAATLIRQEIKDKQEWTHFDHDHVYKPPTKSEPGCYFKLSKLSEKEKEAIYEAQFQEATAIMKKQAQQNLKNEKKAQVLLGGHLAKNAEYQIQLVTELDKMYDLLEQKHLFERVREKEAEIIQQRVQEANKYLEKLVYLENDLQEEYQRIKA
ncbi:pre-mRNA splicing factor component-domain-containing protein [Gorgonomyces haynaldii]|nr:pre-mRNA splicing factor component-domain-containing protein [Gorgonomyces haynaldii]